MQNEIKKQTGENTVSVSFSGDLSAIYEEVLGDFLFEPFAADFVQRISKNEINAVLELACGTGRLTKKLVRQLPATSHIIATDLEADMLKVAKQHMDYPNLSWNTVDMTSIPYKDNEFDLVVSQFGLMLVPDKIKAIQEMHRVLKPGGKLMFSVWGPVNENGIWKIGGEVLDRFLDVHPITNDPGPFSMKEQETLQWLKNAGFSAVKATAVKLTGQITTAAMAAKGFIYGLPLQMAIRKKDPALLPQVEKELTLALIKELGDNPLQSPLNAWVFEADME